MLVDFKVLTRDGAREEGAGESEKGPSMGLCAQVTKSAGTRRTPRKHAGLPKEKGQPRAVGLGLLVEVGGNERKSARLSLRMPKS